jgi:putative transposase
MIEDKVGMIEVSCYIHRNPLEAKIVRRPEYYPWSSYHLYKNSRTIPAKFVNLNSILDYYAGTMDQKREKYCSGVPCDLDLATEN